MQMTLRWFGTGFDSVTLQQIRQIPGVHGVITTLYDTKPGQAWSRQAVQALRRQVEDAGLTIAGIESVNIHDAIKIGSPDREACIDNYIETLRSLGQEISAEINHLITVNLFTTITNANFDKEMIVARIRETLDTKEQLLKQCPDVSALPAAALWNGPESKFPVKAALVGVLSTENEDIRSLREMITYGLKGLSAYSKHANVLMQDNAELDAFLQRALAATLDDSLTVEDYVNLTLETGKSTDTAHIFLRI